MSPRWPSVWACIYEQFKQGEAWEAHHVSKVAICVGVHI